MRCYAMLYAILRYAMLYAMLRAGASQLPPLRNPAGGAILSHGFVEVPALLPAGLCRRLAAVPMDNLISSARAPY